MFDFIMMAVKPLQSMCSHLLSGGMGIFLSATCLEMEIIGLF